ncbi:MAG TPA: ABC transporter ATP-binding protein [Candidatus Nanoarchaeia archaeon]|nr:putative ABC transporter ATP-binding protein YknY [uncultured archaeon]
MIKIEGVTKEYKSGETKFLALNRVSLEIKTGEFVSILGPSGSGKSTLMHLIGGLDRPSQGKIEVDSIDLSTAPDKTLANFRSEKVGFVFQSFNLLNTSSLNNVSLPLVYSKKKFNRKARATELLDNVGLGNRLRNRPSQLSGGEQQRVSIARALVNDPEIVLADEPTGNLDSKTGEQIVELLSNFNKKGKTVVVVTHDEALAKKADRIIRIKDGQVEQ